MVRGVDTHVVTYVRVFHETYLVTSTERCFLFLCPVISVCRLCSLLRTLQQLHYVVKEQCNGEIAYDLPFDVQLAINIRACIVKLSASF